ncbi:MAG: hypothetical protein Q8P75_03720 [bacterium]|nr:hypothetical protein [bacterium]
MTKKNLILIILLIFAAGFVLWLSSLRSDQTEDAVLTPMAQTSNTPEAISADIQGIELGDLDAEFESIDQDLNNL